MNNLLTAFNDHFVEFLSDIQRVFPEDVDILTAKNALLTIRKTNPKIIVKIWTTCVVGEYKKEIDAGDIAFFINKDYTKDIATSNSSDKITESIDRLRNPVKQMSANDQAKVMKYIQNLTKLATLYEST
jgi:Mg2+ and Co2+ transporter CorA